MAKRKHRRISHSSSLIESDGFKAESISSFCHVSGFHSPSPSVSTRHQQKGNDNGGDIDDCLALMDQQYDKGDTISRSSETKDTNNKSSLMKDDNLANNSTKLARGGDDKEFLLLSNKIDKGSNTRKQASSLSNKSIINGEFILPNIQVELARHKLMGELSCYILSECPSLRMPSFERWVMDSKIEERLKRERLAKENRQRRQIVGEYKKHHNSSTWKSRMERKKLGLDGRLLQVTSTGKNPLNRYDPVIPSMPDDINDEASQRLLQEMDSKDIKEKFMDGEKGRRAIVKELCRRANEASHKIQTLNSSLGGGVEAKKYFMKSDGGGNKNRKKRKKDAYNHSLGLIVLDVGTATDEIYPGNLKQRKGNTSTRSRPDPSIGQVQTMYTLSYSRRLKISNEVDETSRNVKPFHVKINATHYDKLRDMFHSIYNRDNDEQYSIFGLKMYVSPVSARLKSSYRDSPATNIFHHLVFCLLVRYASLSGGQQLLDLRGGGMQGAIHSHVFDFLYNFLKSSNIMECFASPFNVYSTRFCSMFHEDLDCHFGSYGDFFSLPIGAFGKIGPVHEANPPFSPSVMELMVQRIEDHLRFADSFATDSKSGDDCNGGKLTFIVIVPSCEDRNNDRNLITNFARKSFRSMRRSPYFSKHIVLKARKHGYVEASQHIRPTRYKDSQYDTSIFILQSETAKKEEKDEMTLTSDVIESGIRDAFASRHLQELSERQSKKAIK